MTPHRVEAILSPAPSYTSTASTPGLSPIKPLPHPRKAALKAGSAKEDAARRYVEGRMLGISRRYVKKGQALEGDVGGVRGYRGFGEVVADLAEVVDVLWLSGTPSLQIPYLLQIALCIQSYLPSFPFRPKATFALLQRMDHVLSSLVLGKDLISGETLPGFGNAGSGGLSRTDMVRIKGVVEGTRVVVLQVSVRGHEDEDADRTERDSLSGEETEEPVAEDSDDDDDDMDGDVYVPDKKPEDTQRAKDQDMEMGDWDLDGPGAEDFRERSGHADVEGENDMDIARVYERTITVLGEALGAEAEFSTVGGSSG